MNERENLSSLIRTKLRPDLTRILGRAGRFADEKGWNSYLVGGSVRDLLLDRATLDLDILVEEHGLEFARGFARAENGYFKLYRRFATAMVILPGARRIDITTTRSERYPHPGALPEVLPGSLEEDLARRDFTINALAVSLNRGNFGELIDLSGGERDLKHKVIRVLHENSFRDDPTRIFRAVRFQQRLGFIIEPVTEKLIRTAVNLKMFEKVSSERLRHELELIFREPSPPEAVETMARYNELRFIHPRLRYSEDLKRRFVGIKNHSLWFQNAFPAEDISLFRLYFGALIFSLSRPALSETGNKFNISKKFLNQLLSLKKREDRAVPLLSSTEPLRPSRIYSLLSGFDREIILILMACLDSETGVARVKNYLSRFRFVSPELTGNDLREMGIDPGPKYREILDGLRAARLDGLVKTRQEEIDLITTLVDTRN